ncbi:MAG: hypothetical protein QOI12_4003 [Alphaproteobacteria bacterium]|jgi:ribosomal protein L13E|nr:hypothetical protein [Alphaproteobacteria bacterium]
MQSKKMGRRPKQPTLECNEWTDTDPKTGTRISVVHNIRGVLATETRHYESLALGLQDMSSSSDRQRLEELCENTRDQLEKLGLPSDRIPFWIQIDDGEWEPDLAGARPQAQRNLRGSTWRKRLEQLTEPLSKERAAGDVLYALTALLKRPGIDEHLWHINRAMNAYRSFSLAGTINNLAAAGIAARKARAAGPAVKRKRANEIRRLIGVHAENYWSSHPILRNDASNTAAQIVMTVNADLITRGLLPPTTEGLKAKTIGDHIRAVIRG